MSYLQQLFGQNNKNILTYLREYGENPFSPENPFCDADGVVLSAISYIALEEVYDQRKFVPDRLRHCCEKYVENLDLENVIQRYADFETKHIFLAMSFFHASRFGTCDVIDFLNVLNPKKDLQYGAIALKLSEDLIGISFRGTDNTISGWKQDFNIASKDSDPGQALSVEFVRKQMEKYPKAKVILAGHSKGGYMAVSAACLLNEEEQKRIAAIYSCDGLVVPKAMKESESHKRIESKLIHMTPHHGVCGMLLWHEKPKYVIASRPEKDILYQHDIYNWQINGKEFVSSQLSPESIYFAQCLSQWITSEVNKPKEIRDVISIFFDAIDRLKFTVADDIFTNYNDIIREVLRGTPPNKRKSLRNAILAFVGIFASHYHELRKNFFIEESKKKKRITNKKNKKEKENETEQN